MTEDISWIKNMGHLHFWENVLWGWIIWLLLVFFIINKEKRDL